MGSLEPAFWLRRSLVPATPNPTGGGAKSVGAELRAEGGGPEFGRGGEGRLA